MRMTGGFTVFFLVLVALQVLMYLAVRRAWLRLAWVAGAGVALSVVAALLMTLANGNTLLYSAVVGLVLGGLFSGVTLAAAWYFVSRDARQAYVAPAPDAAHEEPVA